MRIPGTGLTLGTVRDRETRAMAPTPARRTDAPGSASGVDGGSLFGDLATGGIEFNPELAGFRKFIVYEEMRRSDPAIRSALWLYKLPIRRAPWPMEPASADGIDVEIRDAAAWQFGLGDEPGQLDLTWDEWLQQTMLFFDFGSMFEEPVYAREPVMWKPPGAEGVSRILVPFTRFAPRFPATIDRIETNDDTGLIKRLRQNLPGADWIQGDNLCWYVNEREGRNWHGISLLRSMYGPWRLKKALMIGSGIAYDRYSSGVPVVRYPAGDEGAKQQAERIARDYRSHERAWVVLEGPKERGWDLDIVNGSASIADPTTLLRFYNEEIAAASIQQFSKLGTTASGSRAVGEILIDPFYQAIEAYAEFVAASRRRMALRRFVDFNYGTEFAIPKLSVGRIQQRNILLLAQAMEAASAAGMTFTDVGAQNAFRDEAGLPELADDDRAAIEAALEEEPDLALAGGEGGGIGA